MNLSDRRTIWIVEDDPEICCLFAELLVDFDDFMVVCVDDARHVKAQPHDIIFLDLHGTRASALTINEARVITMSGDADAHPRLTKPFDFRAIRQLILETLTQRSKAA